MKKLLLILVCLLLSNPSFGKWEKTVNNIEGYDFYLNFESLKKYDGYHHIWVMANYPKPSKLGVSSHKIYYQIDCKRYRYKFLKDVYYSGQMGEGKIIANSDKPDKDWFYPAPDSARDYWMSGVCKNL